MVFLQNFTDYIFLLGIIKDKTNAFTDMYSDKELYELDRNLFRKS